MKLKIEKEFKDKFTGEKYLAGSEVDFEDARAKELLADTRELVIEIKDESKKPTKKPKK